MIPSYHFMIEARVVFRNGDTVAVRRDDSGMPIGLDKVKQDTGEFVEIIPGKMTTVEPPDQRTRLPMSVSGVQLWRGY